MARVRGLREPPEQLVIHEDDPCDDDETLDESADPLQDSGRTQTDSSDDEIEQAVAEDIAKFETTFRGIQKRYRLLNRIGEGTFSTVYKAEDLNYDLHQNDWDIEERENTKWSSNGKPTGDVRRKPRYVAIKKIYVTSSPLRILNELELLHDLRDSDSVCPLITAFRHQDQVIAILPYFSHLDFRMYFREMNVSDMRKYFRSLFTALRSVHGHQILHRDIKPTNFLYSPQHERGVLVDFGLAERETTDWHECICSIPSTRRRQRIEHSVHASTLQSRAHNQHSPAYPKTDQRPGRRANRAGTRGFRAPEVLFKCTQQTTAIDMWSAGVILLTFLARRFPFFHSVDDVDALLELTSIFGRRRMRDTALLHGQVFETNIPSYSESGFGFEKIILWCTNRNQPRDQHGRRLGNAMPPDEQEAVEFLERCLECDPRKRITADEALRHPFIMKAGQEEVEGEDDMVDMVYSGSTE